MSAHAEPEAVLRDAARARADTGQRLLAELNAAGAVTFTRFLRDRSRDRADHVALIHADRSWTYAELWDHVDRARAALHATGVRGGQSVSFLMNNSDHYVIWYFAVLGLGAVAVPLNNRLVAREAAYIIEHSASVLIVTEPAFTALLQTLISDYGRNEPRLVLDPSDAESGLGAARYRDEPPAPADLPAALYYTSGTTGQPKGVIHTHRSLMAHALQAPLGWEYDFADVRSLAVTPLFHIAAHTIFYPVLAQGGTLVVDTYDTQATIELIRCQHITAFFAVPSILLLMVDKAQSLQITLPEVRTVMFGAAPMTIARLGDVQALFPNAGLVHGMGQTESSGTLVTLPSGVAMTRAGSVGMALPEVEVAIFDERDQPVPHGQVGELVARGPNIMLGYFRNEAATKVALKSGWLHTGDLGYQTDEGLVTLVDRKKDMIIRGGENIYSSEVEQVLLRHPAVKTAAVVGQPDTIFGEQVAAFVTTDPALPAPAEHELVAHCRRDLADYKVPVTFRFMDELPLTATGKIKKAELRESLPPYDRARREGDQ